MDYTNDGWADQQFIFSQSFNPHTAELLFFTNNVNNFSQETCLNTHFELSQQEPGSWPSDSLLPDPAALVNVSNDFLGAPRSELVTAPFQSGTPSLYHAINGLNTGDMALEEDPQAQLLELAQQVIPPSLLRCNEPGCGNERVYSTVSAFRKHQGKHTRPYACKHGWCNVRPFGDKAGLTRHYREVHGSKVHYCPFRSCSRHTDGFARRYNLLQHQAHCHGDKPLARLHESSESSLMGSAEHDDQLTHLGQPLSEDTDCDSETQSVAEGSCAYSGGYDRLERKLRDLKAKRDRINRAIATLESAQALVGASSS